MYKFVKIIGRFGNKELVYDDWFLMYEGVGNTLLNTLSKRIQNTAFKRVLKTNGLNVYNSISILGSINYTEVYDKYQTPLFIREIGSYMTLSKNTRIIDIMYSDTFPTDNTVADIVVCENDSETHDEWLLHLSHNYPTKIIKVIPFFGSRDIDEIKHLFKGVEYVTFITTFMTYGWFDKLVNALDDQTVFGYGYCSDDDWKYPLSILPTMTQIKELTF